MCRRSGSAASRTPPTARNRRRSAGPGGRRRAAALALGGSDASRRRLRLGRQPAVCLGRARATRTSCVAGPRRPASHSPPTSFAAPADQLYWAESLSGSERYESPVSRLTRFASPRPWESPNQQTTQSLDLRRRAFSFLFCPSGHEPAHPAVDQGQRGPAVGSLQSERSPLATPLAASRPPPHKAPAR